MSEVVGRASAGPAGGGSPYSLNWNDPSGSGTEGSYSPLAGGSAAPDCAATFADTVE
jgi:hypothetical protein